MKNRRKDVFQLVLGAIMLGLFLAVYVIIPVGNSAIQSVVIVVASLPVTLYTLYCGTKKALLVVGAGLALSVFLLQPMVFAAFGAPALVIGLIGGRTIAKGKAVRAVLVIAVLHLVQNILELALAQWLTGIPFVGRFVETVNQGVDMLSVYVKGEKTLIFARDLLYCAIPIVMSGAALGKSMITCYFVHMVMKNKHSPFQQKENMGQTLLQKLNPKVPAGIFLSLFLPYVVVAGLILMEMIAYRFWFAVCTMAIVCCGMVYLFYYYARELTSRELSEQGKYMGAGLLVVLAPVALIVLPVKELLGIKKEKKTEEPKAEES